MRRFKSENLAILGVILFAVFLICMVGEYTRAEMRLSGIQANEVSDDTTPVMNVNNDTSTDGAYSGTVVTLTVDGSEGNTDFGQAMHVDTDGELIAADADGTATMPCIGLLVESGTGAKKVLMQGIAVETDWNWTVGGLVYVSGDPTTTEGLTQTAPTGTGDQAQAIGVALSADAILVNVSLVLVEAP